MWSWARTSTLLQSGIPDLSYLTNLALPCLEIPLSATSSTAIIHSKIRCSSGTYAMLGLFVQDQASRAFHALLCQRTPKWWRTADDAEILVIEERFFLWAYAFLSAGVKELRSLAVLAGRRIRIPKLILFACNANIVVGEIMLRRTHAEADISIINLISRAFRTVLAGDIPICGPWTGDALLILSLHGWWWGTDAWEWSMIVDEGLGAAFG